MCLDQVYTADKWQGKNVKVCLPPRPGHSLLHNAEWMRKFLISLFFILKVVGKLFEVLVEVAAGLWTIQGGCLLLFNEAPVFYSQSIFTSFSNLLPLEDSISSSYLVIYKSCHFCFCVCVCVAGGGGSGYCWEKWRERNHIAFQELLKVWEAVYYRELLYVLNPKWIHRALSIICLQFCLLKSWLCGGYLTNLCL